MHHAQKAITVSYHVQKQALELVKTKQDTAILMLLVTPVPFLH